MSYSFTQFSTIAKIHTTNGTRTVYILTWLILIQILNPAFKGLSDSLINQLITNCQSVNIAHFTFLLSDLSSSFLFFLFGMASMPFLYNGTLLFQGNLPRVLPVIIYKYPSCLIPFIISFLFLFGEWSGLVFKDFQKCFLSQKFFFCLLQLF